MSHPLDKTLARLNPPIDADVAREILRGLMTQWSQLKHQCTWKEHLPTLLWTRLLVVDPKRFREYSAIELALLDKIARLAIACGGWWTTDLFVDTAAWTDLYEGTSKYVDSDNSVKAY